MVISVSCTPESSHTGETYGCKNVIDSKNGDTEGHFHQNGGPAHIKLFLESPAYISRVKIIQSSTGYQQFRSFGRYQSINSPFRRNINMILNFRNQVSTRRIWLYKYIKWNKSLWRKNWYLKYTDRHRWWPNIFGQYRFMILYLLYVINFHFIRSEYLDLLWSSFSGWYQAQARKECTEQQPWYLRDNSIWRL